MHAGHRGYRPGGAEQVRALVRYALAQPVLGLERLEQRHDVTDHGFEAARIDICAALALGERDHADGQRCPSRDAALYLQPIDAGGMRATLVPGQVEPDQLR